MTDVEGSVCVRARVSSDNGRLRAWHRRTLQKISRPWLLQLPEPVVCRLRYPSVIWTVWRCHCNQFCHCCTIQQCRRHFQQWHHKSCDPVRPAFSWRRRLWQQLWCHKEMFSHLCHRYDTATYVGVRKETPGKLVLSTFRTCSVVLESGQ